MKNKKWISGVLFLVVFSSLSLHATQVNIKLRFYEGVRQGEVKPLKFVTSSYLQPTVTGRLESRYLQAEEMAQLKRAFNLQEVVLITEADLTWDSRKSDKIFHIFRLNGQEYVVILVPSNKQHFQVEVFEQMGKKKHSLLDTEIILPERNTAVLGFEDKLGSPYFLSFSVAKKKAEKVSPVIIPGVVGGVTGGVVGKEAVKAEGKIKPPKLIKKVEPVYPEEAREKKVEGVVILEAQTGQYGRVKRVEVLKSKDPLLSEAAAEAVEQWVYEPLILDGEPRGVVFTVTVSFNLEKDIQMERNLLTPPLPSPLSQKPQLIKRVDPVYPEEARKKRIEGVVILKAHIDEKGRVEKTRVLKSESSLLNQAAKEAVEKWVYEPVEKDGKPVSTVLTVTVTFRLK